MSQAIAMVAPTSAEKIRLITRRRSASKILLLGIIKLLEGQRRFADEFGIPHRDMFHPDCQIFRQKNSRAVIQEWLMDTEDGPRKFSYLVNDIIEHNLAIYAALDGVARESIDQLSPRMVKSKGFSIFGWYPFAWLTYRQLHRTYAENDYRRHQEIVVKGFATAYAMHREKVRNEGNTPRVPQPTNSTGQL